MRSHHWYVQKNTNLSANNVAILGCKIQNSIHAVGRHYLSILDDPPHNCLVDSCKRSSVNQMGVVLKLPKSSHGNFSRFYQLFKHTLSNYSIFILEQAVGPEILQIFGTCAVK